MKQSSTLTRIVTGGLVMAVGLITAGTLRAAEGTSHKASSFIQEAAQGNHAEVALAEIAQQKAANSEVKQFAQKLRDDHQQANQQLQPIAQAHNVKLDSDLSFMQKRTQDRLQKLSGAEFDKEYSKAMLEDHVKDIAKYDKAAQSIEETDVKEFARTMLPKLREHLHHGEQAARAAGLDEQTIASITKKVPDAAGGGTGTQERETGTSHKQQ
jgi:predicted outer membrane protein